MGGLYVYIFSKSFAQKAYQNMLFSCCSHGVTVSNRYPPESMRIYIYILAWLYTATANLYNLEYEHYISWSDICPHLA